jgi:hypothetical protein
LEYLAEASQSLIQENHTMMFSKSPRYPRPGQRRVMMTIFKLVADLAGTSFPVYHLSHACRRKPGSIDPELSRDHEIESQRIIFINRPVFCEKLNT